MANLDIQPRRVCLPAGCVGQARLLHAPRERPSHTYTHAEATDLHKKFCESREAAQHANIWFL